MSKYYIVLGLNWWTSLEASIAMPVKFDPAFGQGFLAVFTTREEAEKHANGAEIVEIKTITREANT